MASPLSKLRAQKAINSLGLSGPNEAVAQWWLSLWTADDLPCFSRFRAEDLAEHIQAIAIFAVHPDRVVMCERAGALFERWLGFDLTGHDIISITPAVERERRYAHILQLFDGAISYSESRFFPVGADELFVPEIGLPFSPDTEDEPPRVLFHIGWRPRDLAWLPANFRADTAISNRLRLVPFDVAADRSGEVMLAAS